MWQQTVFIAELWVARMVFIVSAQKHNSCRMHRTCDNAKQWLNGRNNDAEPGHLHTDTGTHDKTSFDYSQSDTSRRWLSEDMLVDWYWFHILQNQFESNYEAAIVRSLLINQAAAVGVLFNQDVTTVAPLGVSNHTNQMFNFKSISELKRRPHFSKRSNYDIPHIQLSFRHERKQNWFHFMAEWRVPSHALSSPENTRIEKCTNYLSEIVSIFLSVFACRWTRRVADGTVPTASGLRPTDRTVLATAF